jgi:hypothetical protein
MELAFAFLAEKAEHSEAKQLWVAAADFDRLTALALPAKSQFCIVLKLRISPEDLGRRHTVRFEHTEPRGQRSRLTEDTEFRTAPDPEVPGRATGASIIGNIGVVLNEPGEHTFHVIIDGHEIKSLPLLVEVKPPQPV